MPSASASIRDTEESHVTDTGLATGERADPSARGTAARRRGAARDQQALPRGQGGRHGRRRGRCRPRDRGRGVLLAARSLRVREDDHPAHDRGLRVPHRGQHPDLRGGGRARAAQPSPRQHRVPVLRAVPAHDGRGEHRLRPADEEGRPGGGDAPGRRGHRPRAAPGARTAQAQAAVRRAAATRGAGPCAGQPPEGAAARRTARRARPQAPPGDADRAQAAPGTRRASPSSTSPTTRRRR